MPSLSSAHLPCRQVPEPDTTTGGLHSPSGEPREERNEGVQGKREGIEEKREGIGERREERREGVAEESANPGMNLQHLPRVMCVVKRNSVD